jgi:hypothetical protein
MRCPQTTISGSGGRSGQRRLSPTVTAAGGLSSSAALFFSGPRIRHFGVRLTVAEQRLFLNLPEVRRAIAHRDRCVRVELADMLISTGIFSLNQAAPRVGMSQSALSKWLIRFRADGPAGLLENRAASEKAAREKTPGVLCRLTFIK